MKIEITVFSYICSAEYEKGIYFSKIAQIFFSISGGIASGICAEGYGVNILEIIMCTYVFLQYYL